MTDNDQRFNRWEFRRTEVDLDSSSDDEQSRPSSASEPKQKLAPSPNPEADTHQTMPSPTPFAKEEKENHSKVKGSKRKPKQQGKTQEKKARTRKPQKTTCNNEPATDGAMFDLRGHMESLVEEIKTARKDLISWMDSAMKSFSEVGNVSSKPGGTKKGQKQNTTRSKTPRNNPKAKRKKPGKTTENGEGEPSERKSPPPNEEVVEPVKETENVIVAAIPVENIEKQKGKRPRTSTKKQKTVGVEADQQSNTTVAAAADSYLTLPTVIPQNQAENSEKNRLEDGNEKAGEKRNALNSGGSSSSFQQKFDPRAQQKDAVFVPSGMPWNVNDYEPITCNTTGNGNGSGNGNGFPFPLVPQGPTGGIGMPNVPSQFGLHYLTQGNRLSGMYREHPGFPSGNHPFMGSYDGFNQHLKYNFQQGEAMSLRCPDIRRGAFNQGNIAGQ